MGNQSGLTPGSVRTAIGPRRNKIVIIPIVLRLATSYRNQTGSPVDYQDVVAEGLLGVARALKDFKPSKKTKLSSYVYMRVNGAVRDIIRREAAKQSQVIVTDPAKFSNISVRPKIEDNIAYKQLLKTVWAVACRELEDDHVHVIGLHYLAGLTISRVAELMRFSEAKVMIEKKQALTKLRESLRRKGIQWVY